MSNQSSQGHPGGQFDFGGSGAAPGQAPASYGSAAPQPTAGQAPSGPAPSGPGNPDGPSSHGGQQLQFQPGPQWGGPSAPDTPPGKDPDGAVKLIAVLAIVVMVIAMGALAIRGNRVLPFSAMTDSAWRGAPGQLGELTDQLRDRGYTCSDEGFHEAEHLHRICAKHAPNSARTIEFGGKTEGDVMFLLANPGKEFDPQAREDLSLAVGATLNGADRQQVTDVAAAGPTDTRIVNGPWGSGGWDEAGQFHVTKNWTGPVSGRTPDGTLGELKTRAEQNQYRCEQGSEAMLQCTYAGDNAQWTLNAMGSGTGLSTVTLEAAISNDEGIDVAEQFKNVLPEGSQNSKAVNWFGSVDKSDGHAGFGRGLRMDYTVEGGSDSRTRVSGSMSTPCYATEGSQFC